jgi:hypothetical protein
VARKGDRCISAYFTALTEEYEYSTISLPFLSVFLPSTAIEINFYLLVPFKTHYSLVPSISFFDSKLAAILGVKPTKQSAIYNYRRETYI